jgi:hypothetical protein
MIPARTPAEKAAACASVEEAEGFVRAAQQRGDEETRQAGLKRLYELKKKG